MAQARPIARRGPRRVEVRFHLVGSTDIALGVAMRRHARRRARSHRARRWIASGMTAACVVIAGLAPAAIAVGSADLARLGSVAFPAPASAPLAMNATPVTRSVVEARSSLVTAVRQDPPALGVHVVSAGETLLSVAARYGITPQTLAYNNAIADSSELRAGRSLVVPPIDAAIHVVREGETVESSAAGFGVDPASVRRANSIAYEPEDVTPGRVLLLPVPDSRYPGFRLRVSDAPRVFAPRVRWPTNGVVTQLFSWFHTGIDIAAPYGSAVVASDSGTVTAVGFRGPGGLAVCEQLDWGLEICDYHLASASVEVGERVTSGERIASVGTTGETTGPHVHWEARTNGVLVDPLTYAPEAAAITKLGSVTGPP